MTLLDQDGRIPERIFCIALALLLAGLALALSTAVNGDGLLYLSTLEALARNASPALDAPVRDAVAQLTGTRPTWLALRAWDGREYPLHFFFYAALCVPARLLLAALGLDVLKAFQLTNALILALAVAWLLLRTRRERWVRWGVSAALLLSAGAFYLQWWHPELMTAAAVATASVAFLERRHPTATGLLALGSLQNPSVALMIPLVLADLVVAGPGARPVGARQVRGLTALLASLLLASIALLPYVWSLAKFRALNPIAATGYVDYANIGVARFASLLFDLNQGAIVGLPLLLWLVPAVALLRLADLARGARNPLRRRDWLLLAFVAMAVPTLAHVNWNSGQSVFMRYAAWSCMTLVVWAFDELESRAPSAQALAAVPALLLQAAIVFHAGGARLIHEAAYSYVLLKPWVPELWARAPHLYNPDPEIFFERVRRAEAVVATPVVYRDAKGTMLKALVRERDLPRIGRELCGTPGALLDERGGTEGLRVQPTSRGLAYVTGRMHCAGRPGTAPRG